MLGVSLSQLVYGPISEGIGRRKPLLTGAAIALLGSIICMFANDINTLLFGRLVQGCGAGAAAALWRTVFRDTFEGLLLAKYGSYMAICVTFIIAAAPVIGGYLQQHISWQSIFVFLSFYSLAILFVIYFFYQETSKHHHKDRLKLSYITKTYASMLTHRIFVGYTLCTFLCYGAIFSWFIVSPILLIDVLGLTPVTFGWILLVMTATAMISSGYINGKLVTRLGMPFMLRLGWSIMLFAGTIMLLAYFFFGVNLYAIVIPALFFGFGVTFIWPNIFGSAFTPFGHIAGYAGALYGSIQIAGAAVIGGFVARLPDHNQIPLALVMIITPILAWCIFEFWVRKAEVKAASTESDFTP